MEDKKDIKVEVISKDSFQDDCDDSSDEETVTRNISQYDIKSKWQQYSESRTIAAEKDDTTKLAFVAHAQGLKLLYCKKTNAEYYSSKKLSLGKNQISNESAWLDYALEQVFNEIKLRVWHFLPNASYHEFRKNYIVQFELWAQRFKSNTRPIFIWLKGNIPSNNILELLKNIFNCFHQFFSSYFPGYETVILQYFITREISPLEVKNSITTVIQQFAGNFTPQYLSDCYTSIPQSVRDILEKYALHQALIYLRDLGGLKGSDDIYHARPLGKNARLKLLFVPNVKYPFLGQYTERWYKHINLDGKSLMANFLKVHYHIKELVIGLVFDFTSTLHNNSNLQDQAQKEFVDLCAKHLNLGRGNPLCRPHVERTLLPSSCAFQSSNPYRFFANIRLSQQDMKRRYKQLLDDRDNKEEMLLGSSYCRIWKFNGVSEAQEIQELTANQDTKSCSRNDKIINFGNYVEISDEILAIQKMINNSSVTKDITSKGGIPPLLFFNTAIAVFVRKTLQGICIKDEICNNALTPAHSKKIEFCVVNLTQLLFGCEGTRNPAVLILHQMMLDLIIYSNFTWQQMFCKTSYSNASGVPVDYPPLMPMAMTNAVPSARVLHQKFSNYMPHPYQYFGSELQEKSEELLRTRYPLLINAWLINYIKDPQKDLELAINESLERWYNILPELPNSDLKPT